MRKLEEKILFSWLHLSDIHFLHGSYYNQIDQEMILNSLCSYIKQSCSGTEPSVPKPDAIFVTGDIAYSGGEINSDEYKVAEKWLLNIAEVLKIGPEFVFTVPGNHDIQRSIFDNDDDVSKVDKVVKTIFWPCIRWIHLLFNLDFGLLVL